MTRALPEPTFRRFVAGIGTLSLRPFDLTEDVTTLHSWVTQPYAPLLGPADRVRRRRARGVPPDRSGPATTGLPRRARRPAGVPDGALRAVVRRRRCDVRRRRRATSACTCWSHRRSHRCAGFTGAVFETILDSLFSDPLVDRVVVEPDVRNSEDPGSERADGVPEAQRGGPAGQAGLAELLHPRPVRRGDPDERGRLMIDHLTPDAWAVVNRALVRKALAEFTHERTSRTGCC